MRHRVMDSPVGPITLVVDDDGALVWVLTEGQQHFPDAALLGERDDEAADEAVRQLTAWFAGEVTHFDLPSAVRGTAFQQRVWQQIAAIPFGETRTYGQIAEALGTPAAARAVGAATGRNPLSIVVPCHRVMGASGALTGYAGGVARKRWLLAHERAVIDRPC